MRGSRAGRVAFAIPLTLAGFAIATPALAQPAASDDDDEATITVTAQLREEALQDVPISIAVVSGETLQDLQLNESTDLQYIVPGLSSPRQAGPRNFGYFIRGVGTTTFSSETIEPSSSYVVDGVVLAQGGASLTDLPDIEQIEVLRGPQSTLFGKNASAGVINITTRRPSAEFEVRGGISWGWPDDDRRYYGYVTGPISDTMRFSLSGRRNQRDGYVQNVFDGRTFNNRDDFGFRGRIEWQPSAALRATLIGDYWESSADCCIWTFLRFGPPANFLEQLSLDAGIVPGRDNLQQNIDGDVFSNYQSYGTSLQLDYEIGGGHTLTSITAWRGFETVDGLDSDSSPFDILNTNFGDHHQNQLTQELRLRSPTGGFVDYVAGLYYFRQRVRSFTDQFFPTVPFPFFDREVNVLATTRNMAVFGQANFNVTPDLRLIAGARLLNERQRVSKDRVDARLGLADSATAVNSDTTLTWRGGIEYDFTDDVMAFATVSRGYKGGGFDTNIAVQTLDPVGPERPTSYEIGLRTSWPDAGLTFNVTAFKADINGYQTASRNSVTLTFPIANGDANTQGVEVDASWRPVRGADFFLTLGAAYTDATWGAFANAPCYAGQTVAQGCVGGVQDLTGRRLPFAPKFAFNATAAFSQPLTRTLKFSSTVNLNYRSTQVIGVPNSPDAIEPGYALLNATIGIGHINDRWRLSLFGKNLTDENFITFTFNTGIGSVGLYRVHESRRIIGVALDVAF